VAAPSVLASSSGAIAAALVGVFLAADGFSGWVLIGYVVHLLLASAVPIGVWLEGLVQVLLDCGGSFGFL
jgi:hypothetical protein